MDVLWKVICENKTGQLFPQNIWVGVELTDAEFIALELSGTSPDDNYERVYFLDEDKSTQLPFIRIAWDAEKRYAFYLVSLPSLSHQKTIYIATDSAEDLATIKTVRYADLFLDLDRFFEDLSGHGLDITTKSGYLYVTFSSNLTYNDTFIACADTIPDVTTYQALMSANGYWHGIRLDKNYILGIRCNSAVTSYTVPTGLHVFCSKYDYAFVDEEQLSWSGAQQADITTNVLVVGAYNTGGSYKWQGTVHKAIYFQNKNITNDQYLGFYYFFKQLIRTRIEPENFVKGKLVVSWDTTGVQIYNPRTNTWIAKALPATSYDGSRIITLKKNDNTVVSVLQVKEYDHIIADNTAKWHAAPILVRRRKS